MPLPSELMGGEDDDQVIDLFFLWDNCGHNNLKAARHDNLKLRGSKESDSYGRQTQLSSRQCTEHGERH